MSKTDENKAIGEHREDIRYVPIPSTYLQSHFEPDEIDLWELVRKIWLGRVIIVKSVIILILIGLLVAFGSSETYTSEVKILPVTQQQSSLGGLGGLARQFGVGSGMNNTRDGIPPTLYPDIIHSTQFLRQLLNMEVSLPDENRKVTLRTYYLEHQEESLLNVLQKYTVKLPFTVLSSIRERNTSENELSLNENPIIATNGVKSQVFKLSSEELQLLRALRSVINSSEAINTGVITIRIEMGDSVIAAEVAMRVVEQLSEYVTNYRTEKAKLDVEFISDRYEEAKSRFNEAQLELAKFSDENRGNLTAVARITQQSLQSNYSLTFNLYNSMSERLEEARIKLQEETPIINILEHASVPDSRTSPKRAQILIIYTMLGGLIGIVLIFAKQMWRSVKEKKVFEV